MPSSVPAAVPSRLARRIVLGGAFLLALAMWQAPRTTVHAQEAKPPAPGAPAVTPPAAPKTPASPGSGTYAKDASSAQATIRVETDANGKKTVTVEKSVAGEPDTDPGADAESDVPPPVLGVGPGRHGKRVTVGVFGKDREYDSFNDFVHNEPELAGMIVGIVAIVFLSPVLVIALILWYRMRKNRMLNETMLKLAEKGVVPPAEALGALAGNAPMAMTASPSAAPFYEQAKQIRRGAAWSDLRKGVIMGGIGLGSRSFSMLDDGTPNSIGLVLLFVGIGYLVLWWFEDRQVARAGNGTAGASPTTPVGGPGGSA